MKLVVLLGFLCGFAARIKSQTLSPKAEDIIKNLFSTTTTESDPTGLYVPGLKTVPTASTPSYKASIKKCGEGNNGTKWICVNYDYCDPDTMTVKEDGVKSGFGVIGFRLGGTCPHYMENCCKIPPSGLSPTFDPTARPSTTTSTPILEVSHEYATLPTNSTTISNVEYEPIIPTPSTCGVRNSNGIDFKLTGTPGNEAEYGEFPWMVAVMKRSSSSVKGTPFSFCGGALLGPSVVITAAHCVYNYTAENLKVRVGEWDSQTTRERLPYQERVVDEIVLHEQLVAAGGFNDFALLILKTPVDSAEHIGTICLPEQDQVIESDKCYVTGWGKDVYGEAGIFVDILKKVEIPIVPVEKCQSSLRQTILGNSFQLHESFICAGGEKGKDACTGDGGSPLVCPDPNNPDRYILTGLVSWGIECGNQDVPGVYAAVSKARSWIDEKLRGLRLGTTLFTYP